MDINNGTGWIRWVSSDPNLPRLRRCASCDCVFPEAMVKHDVILEDDLVHICNDCFAGIPAPDQPQTLNE